MHNARYSKVKLKSIKIALENRRMKVRVSVSLTTKFSSVNFQTKKLSPSDIILRIQRLEGKQFRSRL